MRLAVLADVHANLPGLEAVLRDVEQHSVDGFIVAGDLSAGPHANEITHLLRSLGSWMIRGNTDSRLLRFAAGDTPEAWRTLRQFALLRWCCDHLDGATLEFIRSLPEQRTVEFDGTAPIRVVHGSPRDPSEGLDPHEDPASLELALAQVDEPVLVCAHSHRPWQVQRGGRLALNPGAISGPLNGEVGAQYALLTWQGGRWRAEHHTVPYDLERLRRDYRESGFLEGGGALALAFLLSEETGRDVGLEFLSYAHGLAAQAGLSACEFIPDAIWAQAERTFAWDAVGRGAG